MTLQRSILQSLTATWGLSLDLIEQESNSNVSFGFPNSFRLTDFLPTAVLPADLSMSAPTRLDTIATAVSHLSSYINIISCFSRKSNFFMEPRGEFEPPTYRV